MTISGHQTHTHDPSRKLRYHSGKFFLTEDSVPPKMSDHIEYCPTITMTESLVAIDCTVVERAAVEELARQFAARFPNRPTATQVVQ